MAEKMCLYLSTDHRVVADWYSRTYYESTHSDRRRKTSRGSRKRRKRRLHVTRTWR